MATSDDDNPGFDGLLYTLLALVAVVVVYTTVKLSVLHLGAGG